LDKEIVTLGLDSRTAFTKWVTQKPWEQDTRLTASVLKVGQYVAIHRRTEDLNRASWVQIATDVPAIVALSNPALNPVRGVANDPVALASASDLLSSSEVLALIANARTPSDHMKLSRHFAALAAQYDADAADHAAEAKAYRAKGTPSETKRPGTPGTAAHCERLAELARDAAATARELSVQHKDMAASVK